MKRISLPFTIRHYRSNDLATLHAIDQACFPPDLAFSRIELLFYLKHRDAIARIAENSGTILGFVVGRIENGTVGHVLTLDVLLEARRTGIGTFLMEALHDEFGRRNVLVTMLEVNAEDKGARRFYEKLGYGYLEKLPGYYYGRLDAYRMMRYMQEVSFPSPDSPSA